MTVTTIIPNQLWQVHYFFPMEQYTFVRDLYRTAENNLLKMQYDNRLQTDCISELNNICQVWAPYFSELVGEELIPQVGWACVDLPDAKIHMHKLHPDIKVQVQIPLTVAITKGLEYAFCTNSEVNNSSIDDHKPLAPVDQDDCEYVKHLSRSAIVYKNSPRTFNGMMNTIPLDTVRETLWLNYTQFTKTVDLHCRCVIISDVQKQHNKQNIQYNG